MANGSSISWGSALKGIGYIATAVAATIVVSAVGGYALSGLGAMMTPTAPTTGAFVASWGSTISSLGAQVSGFSGWLAETVMWPITKLVGTDTAKTIKDTLDAGSSLTVASSATTEALSKVAASATGTAARASVGLGVGLLGAGANAVASRSEQAAQRQAVGKFTERVLQEEARAQIAGLDRQV